MSSTVSQLKNDIPGGSSTTPPEPIQAEVEDHFEVEALLKHRSRGNSQQYLVRWLGYGPEHDEWIYEEELADVAGVSFEAVLGQSWVTLILLLEFVLICWAPCMWYLGQELYSIQLLWEIYTG